jgi:4-hydroxythreonine-4-phosphate dehydrogenase
MSDQKIKIAISQGDVNGIGWEVILKTFSDPTLFEYCIPAVFSNMKTANFHRKALGNEEYPLFSVKPGEALQQRKINIVTIFEEELPLQPGKADPALGKYAVSSLHAATEAVLSGYCDVLLTAPLNKNIVHSDDFPFKGHTSYLEQKSGTGTSLMLLCSSEMRVGLVTEHVAISQVAFRITTEGIMAKLKVFQQALKRDFGLTKPRIAVLGLNPHAGDGGTIGSEEQTLIIPAIQQMEKENLLIKGPYAADGFFGSGAWRSFDGILAMYHDQGLGPFKALSFSEGVNYTAGLPFVRTSPDHGTGFDIAGKNLANPASFRNALYFALDVFRKRKEFDQLTANPLASQPLKRER